MKKVPAHIQIQGVPLCVCKDHLLGTKTPDDEWITCGFADAQRVKIHLQKRNHSVRVVRGECQAFWGDEA
jgi:hypothetical protein